MSAAAGPIASSWCAVEEAGSRLLVRWGGAGFDQIRADWRLRFPRHKDAVYLPDQRAWSVPREHMRRLEAWLALWFDDEAMTWERQAAAPRVPATAYQILCLTPDAPAELVEAARRILAKRYHPDVAGGDMVTMQRINAAADLLLAAEPRFGRI